MASTDATAIPVKNQAYRATFPIYDNDGDLVTGAAGLDSEVSKDAGTFADCTNEATEIATSSGIYYLDLTSTEMNADTVAVIVKSSTTNAKTTVLVFHPQEGGDIKVNVTQWNGTAVPASDTAGYPKVTIKSGTGTGELSLTSGHPTGSAGKIVTSPGYLGIFKTTNAVSFFCNTFSPTTSAAMDADSPPTARVYNQNGTLIDGAFSMSKVDDSNTTGFYSDNIDLVDEGMNIAGGRYFIYIEATVDGVIGTACCTFDVEPTVTTTIAGTVSVNVTQISGDSTAADNLEAAFDGTGYAGGTIKQQVDAVAISGDTVAADNMEADYDGTGYSKANSSIGSTTTIAGTGISAIWAKVCEAQGSYTAQQIMSILLAALAGVTDDGGSTLKTPNGASTRVAATVDADNDERTAMTLTPSS